MNAARWSIFHVFPFRFCCMTSSAAFNICAVYMRHTYCHFIPNRLHSMTISVHFVNWNRCSNGWLVEHVSHHLRAHTGALFIIGMSSTLTFRLKHNWKKCRPIDCEGIAYQLQMRDAQCIHLHSFGSDWPFVCRTALWKLNTIQVLAIELIFNVWVNVPSYFDENVRYHHYLPA